MAAYTNKEGIVLFDLQTDRRWTLWSGSGVRAAHLRFSSDGRVLLAGLEDGLVRAWSTSNGDSVLVLETGDSHVAWLDVSADGLLLATAGRNDCLKIWECQWPE